MKIYILYALCMILLCSYSNGKNTDLPSGIYINGKLEYSLQSAYFGGAIADPDKGSSYRMRFYDSIAQESPFRIDRTPKIGSEKVYISGFKYKGTEYSKPGQYVDHIKVDNLLIPLNQGVYENGNPEVSSVEFISYKCSKETADIRISIKLKKGKRIDIIYSGPASYDGLF